MMKPVKRIDGYDASAEHGRVVPYYSKALWVGGMLGIAVVLGPATFTWGAFVVFVVLTYATLLVGHSVGMHRMMIHRAFECSKWLERTLIYIGVLVGVAGPYGIIQIHDVRDWAQRQSKCHDFFAHKRGFFRDLTWQLGYRFEFDRPPTLNIEPNLSADPWYILMERTWRFHQIGVAIPLYAVGGLPWVVWGVCARVAISAIGHWSVTYFCHNPGPGRWRVKGAYVQASNLPAMGIATYGECWHNNHHAFPESARIGLEPHQCDPAWRFIQVLQFLGLVVNVGVPRPEDQRDDLKYLPGKANS